MQAEAFAALHPLEQVCLAVTLCPLTADLAVMAALHLAAMAGLQWVQLIWLLGLCVPVVDVLFAPAMPASKRASAKLAAMFLINVLSPMDDFKK